MTQEDNIRMAREADPKANLSEPYCLDHETREWLEAFAALVAAAEREECAKVCDDLYRAWTLEEDEDEIEPPDAIDCKLAIQARGQA